MIPPPAEVGVLHVAAPVLPGFVEQERRSPPAPSALPPLRPIAFFVAGTPKTQGSMRAFVVPAKAGKKARAVVTHDSAKVQPWRKAIATEAAQHRYLLPGARPYAEAVSITLTFALQRPRSHYTGGGAYLKKTAPRFPIAKRDDGDKLARACLDALTGVLLADDSVVVDLHVRKRFAWQPQTAGAFPPGVRIELNPIT